MTESSKQLAEIDKQIKKSGREFVSVVRDAEPELRKLIKQIRAEMKQFESTSRGNSVKNLMVTNASQTLARQS